MWYTARAGGMLAFGLLTITVLLGVLLAGRKTLRGWPRFAVEDIHKFANVLTWTFIGIHGGALLLDSYFDFGLVQVLVPFTAPYRPMAVAAGVVGAEVLAALAVTNRLKDRLPYSTWRRAHYLNFAVWLLVLVHGIIAGTDSGAAWAVLVYLGAAGSVVAATTWRAVQHLSGPWGARLWPAVTALAAAEFTFALVLHSTG
jgi:methionine sulfoxide reductase heme-binding subunit